jgi:hypothetical protein
MLLVRDFFLVTHEFSHRPSASLPRLVGAGAGSAQCLPIGLHAQVQLLYLETRSMALSIKYLCNYKSLVELQKCSQSRSHYPIIPMPRNADDHRKAFVIRPFYKKVVLTISS